MNIINIFKDCFNNRLRISAMVTKGLGCASTTIKEQIKFFIPIVPNISTYHLGTINLLTETPIIFNNPELYTDYIKWHPVYAPEKFQFVPCELEANGIRVDAVIYIPSWSPHTPSVHKWEVIASKFIDGLNSGSIVTIIFPKYVKRTKWGVLI